MGESERVLFPNGIKHVNSTDPGKGSTLPNSPKKKARFSFDKEGDKSVEEKFRTMPKFGSLGNRI